MMTILYSPQSKLSKSVLTSFGVLYDSVNNGCSHGERRQSSTQAPSPLYDRCHDAGMEIFQRYSEDQSDLLRILMKQMMFSDDNNNVPENELLSNQYDGTIISRVNTCDKNSNAAELCDLAQSECATRSLLDTTASSTTLMPLRVYPVRVMLQELLRISSCKNSTHKGSSDTAILSPRGQPSPFVTLQTYCRDTCSDDDSRSNRIGAKFGLKNTMSSLIGNTTSETCGNQRPLCGTIIRASEDELLESTDEKAISATYNGQINENRDVVSDSNLTMVEKRSLEDSVSSSCVAVRQSDTLKELRDITSLPSVSSSSSSFFMQRLTDELSDNIIGNRDTDSFEGGKAIAFPCTSAVLSVMSFGAKSGSTRLPESVVPYGSSQFFEYLKTLPQPELNHLSRIAARYRRNSLLDATPSVIVSINLCGCVTPHPDPVASFEGLSKSSFWVHRPPSGSPLPGTHDTALSVMLVELHADLYVTEFLEHRLPAIVRQQVGNRLDKNFVVQIHEISFFREHLAYNWVIEDLPECTPYDMERLHAHPLYQRMLQDVSSRANGVPSFRNLNLCPIRFLPHRPWPTSFSNGTHHHKYSGTCTLTAQPSVRPAIQPS